MSRTISHKAKVVAFRYGRLFVEKAIHGHCLQPLEIASSPGEHSNALRVFKSTSCHMRAAADHSYSLLPRLCL
jgi:hypothetical protein